MLEVLFVWLLFGLTAVYWGGLIAKWLGMVMQITQVFTGWVNLWTGFVFISFITLITTFFTPLSPGIKLLIWLAFVAPILYDYKWILNFTSNLVALAKSLSIPALFMFSFTALLALLKSAGVPEIFDEGAYHLPLIRMWEQKGIVIGMANLNGHYGLNSTWHVLSAMANFTFIPGWHTAMALNGLVVTALGLYAATRISEIPQSRRISTWLVALLPVLIFRNLISSPSTDIPAIVASWFVFTLWLENIERQRKLQDLWPMLFLVPIWIVMLKSSSAALLLIPAGIIILFLKEGRMRTIAILFSIGFSLLLPWILENWLLTGYVVFPVRFTAIGHPDWQVPLSSIDRKFYLEQFGAFAPPKAYTWPWLSAWFSAHNPDTRIILLLALAGMIVGLLFLIKDSENRWEKVFLYGTVFICLLVWMLTITEPRYGFGALVFAALFPVAHAASKLHNRLSFFRISIWFVVAFQGFNLYKTAKDFDPDKTGIWQPAARPHVAFRSVNCGNFQASMPTHYRSEVPAGKPPFCWDCPFPCIPKEGSTDSLHLYETRRFGRLAYLYKN